MKRLLFCLCLLLGVGTTSAVEHSIMPPGFEHIELGVSWKAFLEIRTQVEIFNVIPESNETLKPDPAHPKGGLIETFPPGSDFSTGFYVFENGLLVAIMFGKSLESSPSERESFLREVADTYGMPATFSLMQTHQNHGVMTWQQKNTQVRVIVPLHRNTRHQTLIALRIITQEYAERLNVLEQQQVDRKQTQTQTTTLDTLKQEMAGYVNIRKRFK